MIMACIFVASIGFLWSLISFLKNKGVDDGFARNKLVNAKIGLLVSTIVMGLFYFNFIKNKIRIKNI